MLARYKIGTVQKRGTENGFWRGENLFLRLAKSNSSVVGFFFYPIGEIHFFFFFAVFVFGFQRSVLYVYDERIKTFSETTVVGFFSLINH